MAACCKDAVELPLQKSQLSQRWLMLALLCTGLLGSYCAWRGCPGRGPHFAARRLSPLSLSLPRADCYDNPSATQVAMQQYFAGGSGNATSTDDDSGASDSFTVDFNNLYSVYSWPNVVLPFFGGYLSDRLGTRLMLLVFLLFITLGQAIFAVGASLPGMAAWYVMWAGRTVFGFGGESLSVAQSALIASWFGGKELAFALGLNLSLARLGSVINDKVSNYLASDYSVPTAFWAGFGVCLLSLLAGAATYALDERSEDRLRSNAGRRPLPRTSLLALALCLPAWARCCRGASSLASEQDALEGQVEGSLQEEEAGLLAAGKEGGFEPEEPTEVIELSAASQFPLSFWLLCVSCVCTYVCVLCFNNVAEAFFAQKWLATQDGEWLPVSQLSADTQRRVSDQATTLLLITYLVAAFLAPIFGAVIDYVGYRAVLTAVSSGLITVRARAAPPLPPPSPAPSLPRTHALATRLRRWCTCCWRFCRGTPSGPRAPWCSWACATPSTPAPCGPPWRW